MSNAQAGIERAKQGEVQTPKSIDSFNKELEDKKKQEEANKASADKKPFVTPSGKHKCINKGCNKEFDPEANSETSCNFHPGAPVGMSNRGLSRHQEELDLLQKGDLRLG